jgi:triosephosphate isomerase
MLRSILKKNLIKLMAVPEVAEDSWASAKRTPVVGGNWKSNGDRDFISTFPKEVLNKSSWDSDKLEVCVAPTDIHLSEVQNSVKEDFNVMAQNVSRWPSGAFTGNITAHMLKDIGVNWALTGHSERRTKNGTTDQDVAVKTKVAIENGMTVMACIGEGLEEREMGKADKINARQLQAIADEL